MKPAYDNIIKVGSQELVPIGEGYRFVIQEVLPHTGFKFKFSIRKRIIDEITNRGKRLEVRFSEFPDISFDLNPIQWANLAERKKEVKLFKNLPMEMFYYYVGLNGELTNKMQPVEQGVLL